MLTVVALALSAVAAFAEGPAVGRRVTREMARAVCVVSGGDCRRDREPCVVTADRQHRDRRAELVILHIGDERTVLVEQRSDGTVAVTWTTGLRTGVELSLGLGGRVAVPGAELQIGGELRASALATDRSGRTWIVPSADAAAALIGRLRGRGPVPPPDLLYGENVEADGAGVSVTAGAERGTHGIDLAELAADLGFERRTGVRLDRRTGHRTLYATSGAQASGSGNAAGGVLGLSRSASTRGEVYALEIDEHGEPLDLAVVASGVFGSSADLPDLAQPVAGRLAVDEPGTRLYEVEAHLDLVDPGNLAAARKLLTTLRMQAVRFGDVVAASQALRRRIAERGTVEARALGAVTTTSSRALSGRIGVEVGAGQEEESQTVRLLAAVSRGLDGQWLAREDCVDRA